MNRIVLDACYGKLWNGVAYLWYSYAMMKEQIDLMLAAYIECALWSTPNYSDEFDEPDGNLDDAYDADDLSPETLAEMRQDCEAFAKDNEIDLLGMDVEQIGHDFWLTRNRHGAGFWDRGLGARGDRLTDAAHAYGEVDIYVGDDGKLHV